MRISQRTVVCWVLVVSSNTNIVVDSFSPPFLWILGRKSVPESWLDEFIQTQREYREQDLDVIRQGKNQEIQMLQLDKESLRDENERLRLENERLLHEVEESDGIAETSAMRTSEIEARASKLKA